MAMEQLRSCSVLPSPAFWLRKLASLSLGHRSSFPFCSPLKFVSMFDITMSDTISVMSKSEQCFCLISSKQHRLMTSCFLHTKPLLTHPKVTQTGTVSPQSKKSVYWQDQHRRKDNRRSYISYTESQEKDCNSGKGSNTSFGVFLKSIFLISLMVITVTEPIIRVIISDQMCIHQNVSKNANWKMSPFSVICWKIWYGYYFILLIDNILH